MRAFAKAATKLSRVRDKRATPDDVLKDWMQAGKSANQPSGLAPRGHFYLAAFAFRRLPGLAQGKTSMRRDDGYDNG